MSPTLVPYLSYREPGRALRFLEQAFGFEVTVRWEAEDGTVAHAEAVRGEAAVMMGTAAPPSLELDGQSVGQGLYLVDDDVDSTFERARSAGAEVVFPPEDTEWGTRRARVRDPEGYEWSFGTYRPGGRPDSGS